MLKSLTRPGLGAAGAAGDIAMLWAILPAGARFGPRFDAALGAWYSRTTCARRAVRKRIDAPRDQDSILYDLFVIWTGWI